MAELLLIFVGAMLVNNFTLMLFLGLCPHRWVRRVGLGRITRRRVGRVARRRIDLRRITLGHILRRIGLHWRLSRNGCRVTT